MGDWIIWVVGAAIQDERGRIFAARRGPGGSNGGRWEFPGGKVERGETPEEALAREISEELGVVVDVGGFIARGESPAGRRTVRLDVYGATLRSGTIELREHTDCVWLERSELAGMDWAPADLPAVDVLSSGS